MDEVSDRIAIIDVLNRYAQALDKRQWSLLDTVFTPDVEFDFGAWQAESREDAVKAIRSYLDDCGPTQHLLGNYWVKVEGDEAESRVYVRAFHVGIGAASGKTYEMGGEYHDLLRRTPDGWRSAKRNARVIYEAGSYDVLGPGSRGA